MTLSETLSDNIELMLTELQVVNISKNQVTQVNSWEEDTFVLETCQRNLFLNVSKKWSPCANDHLTYDPDFFEGPEAYQFLLETICGLQSRVQGESEITSQFKETFKEYLAHDSRNPQVLKIIQKLFQDAKEIRTKYLKGLGQRSYAAIARKLILKNNIQGPILILGTGQLSQDLILTLNKSFEVHISGRNQNKTRELCEENDLTIVQWKDFNQYQNYAAVICAIGCDNKLIDDLNFFKSWSQNHKDKKVFIDFGSPSILNTGLGIIDNVFTLEDILEAGALQNKERDVKIQSAQKAIREILKKRRAYFQK
jgi:glutamyl-tRNA reductase